MVELSQNSPKNADSSYKMELDFGMVLSGRKKFSHQKKMV